MLGIKSHVLLYVDEGWKAQTNPLNYLPKKTNSFGTKSLLTEGLMFNISPSIVQASNLLERSGL